MVAFLVSSFVRLGCLSFFVSFLYVLLLFHFIFFFKQKTAYEMRISDWSSDVCSSDLVIEHVEELTPFLRNLREALAPNGISIHRFPLSHCMQEAHVRVPFSHWIRDFHYRVAWIKLMSRLGIGKYRHDRRILGHADVQSHAIQSAKFIECWTSYRSFREITAESSRLHMATSYNFTKDFFFTKLRMILRRPASRPYRRRTAFGLEWLGFIA